MDALVMDIRAVPIQPGEKGMDYPIQYANKKISTTYKKYNTINRETLGMIYALQRFKHHLINNKFNFYIDHQALKYILN